jgi:ATP-dependent Clp protease ATP-binding subunit ClpC
MLPYDNRLTEFANLVLMQSHVVAHRLKHNTVGSQHILIALLMERDGVASRVLHNFGLTLDRLEQGAVQHTPREQKGRLETLTVAEETQRVIQWAFTEAEGMGNPHVGTEHLLLGISRLTDCAASRILERNGISSAELRRQIGRVLQKSTLHRGEAGL